jgi:hypothetical protein
VWGYRLVEAVCNSLGKKLPSPPVFTLFVWEHNCIDTGRKSIKIAIRSSIVIEGLWLLLLAKDMLRCCGGARARSVYQ